jgi:anti-anti-sigma regulatory factor
VPLAGRPQDNVAAVERVGTPFDMHESSDLDGALRLTLLGGLDIVVSDRLTARLRVLRSWGRHVRIDLSGLEFVDCTGLEAIIDELDGARRAGQPVEVDRPVSPPVKRVITFMDVADVLWPPDLQDVRPKLRLIEGDARSESVDAVRRPFGVGEDHSELRPTSPGALTSDG